MIRNPQPSVASPSEPPRPPVQVPHLQLSPLGTEKGTQGGRNEPEPGASVPTEKLFSYPSTCSALSADAGTACCAPSGPSAHGDSRSHRGLSPPRQHLGASGSAPAASEATTAGDEAPPQDDGAGARRSPAAPPAAGALRAARNSGLWRACGAPQALLRGLGQFVSRGHTPVPAAPPLSGHTRQGAVPGGKCWTFPGKSRCPDDICCPVLFPGEDV